MTNKQLINKMCELCQNDTQTCKFYEKNSIYICTNFIPKYNCDACQTKCKEFGELCCSFIPKQLVNEANKEHPVGGSVKNLLMELLKLEKSTNSAINSFEQELEANGIKASLFNRSILLKYVDKLLSLHVLNELITDYGLEDYKERILKNEIDRIFTPIIRNKQNSDNPQK